MKSKIVFLLAFSIFMTASVSHSDNIPTGEHSILAEILGGFYIGHYKYGGKLIDSESSRNATDSTFEIVPGLVNYPGTISFRAITRGFEDYYLIHHEFRIILAKKDAFPDFNEHATFWVEAPNFDPKDKEERASFRSYNFPSHFIRHNDFELFIAAGADLRFKRDTSFRVVGSNALEWLTHGE